MSDAATIPILFDSVEEIYGRVDVFVNNAAHCDDPDTIPTTSLQGQSRRQNPGF